MNQKVNAFLETFGCTYNKSDSEILKGKLKSTYSFVNDPHLADVIILNTCAVKKQTEKAMLRRIREFYNEKELILAGCLPHISTNLQKTFPKITILDSLSEPKLQVERCRLSPVTAIVPISKGCLGVCAYCCVRHARGSLESFMPDTIVQEIQSGLKEGCREIQLTAQDLGCYGIDIGIKLPALIRDILAVQSDFRLRLGMMNPAYLKSYLFDLIPLIKDPRLYNFIHLPVQSGSDKILELMKRNYTTPEVIEIVNELKENIPDLTLSTDVIVGFPGELSQDFEETRELIKLISPNILNISRFGTRPFAPASDFKNQTPDRIKKDRSRILARDFHNILQTQKQKWIGCEFRVLVIEKARKRGWVSRAPNYLQVILSEGKPGDFMDVKIVDAGLTYLIGEPI